jgi:hypothetical protein
MAALRSFRPNGFVERHYVRSADRSVWRTTLPVSACQQRISAGLTNRTMINPRNFGNERLSYGITRQGLRPAGKRVKLSLACPLV